jgi:predicted transcriptional regulator
MEKANAGQKQFFKDLAATAEQFVQEARSFEENCYKMIQGMSTALPWLIRIQQQIASFRRTGLCGRFGIYAGEPSYRHKRLC